MITRADRWQVRTQRPIAYDVIKAPRLFDADNRRLFDYGRSDGGRRFVVVDANVDHLHGKAIRDWFAHQGIEARVVVFPGGEEHKTIALYQDILRELDGFLIHRRDEPIIAIGGGVLTDVVAFVAATYRRGIPHIKVPTTLMGYIDAALGIKAGINFNGNKNRLGSFEPPAAVLLDKHFLRTLPARHLRNGVCEIVKLAVVCDADLFERLERDGARCIETAFLDAAGDAILDAAIQGMLTELEPNLHEDQLARKVDFGHSFSYGLETRHEQHLLHGEAVLLDVLVSTELALSRGLLGQRQAERVFGLVASLGIDLDPGVLDAEVMWQSLLDRIEHRNGLQRVPVPNGIGSCTFLNDIARRELDAAVPALHARLKVTHEPSCERR